jgi:hypothetical protein
MEAKHGQNLSPEVATETRSLIKLTYTPEVMNFCEANRLWLKRHWNQVIWCIFCVFIGIIPTTSSQAAQPNLSALGLVSVGQPNSSVNFDPRGRVKQWLKDGSTNLFAAGDFRGFLTMGSFNITNDSSKRAMFVARLDDSRQPVWIKNSDQGMTLRQATPHPNGGIAVLGYFRGPATNHFGSTSLATTSAWSCAILRLDTAGNVQQTLYLESSVTNSFDSSGTNLLVPFSIDSSFYDTNGNFFIVGDYLGAIRLAGVQLTNPLGINDVNYFAAKIAANGNVQWLMQGGSAGQDDLDGVAKDAAGNVFLIGTFRGTNYFGSQQLVAPSPSEDDGFLIKLNPDGTVAWGRQTSTVVSGHNPTYNQVVADGVGGCFVAGSRTLYTNTLVAYGTEAFVARYNAAGMTNWVLVAAGPTNVTSEILDSTVGNIYRDSLGNIYLGGNAYVNFAFGGMVYTNILTQGAADAFLIKLNASGTPQWLRQIGGGDNHLGWDYSQYYSEELEIMSMDKAGNIYLAGQFDTAIVIGTNELDAPNGQHWFLTKLTPTGDVVWATQMGGSAMDFVTAVLPDEGGSLDVAGMFGGVTYANQTPIAGPGKIQSYVARFTENSLSNAGPRVLFNPLVQTVLKGTNVELSVTALGKAPLSYQWKKNGVDLPGATDAALDLYNLLRADTATYSVAISNAYGGTVSSNAAVRVRSPQQLAGQVSSNGIYELLFGDADGEPMTNVSLAFFKVEASTNLGATNWTTLTGTLLLTNGLIKLDDAGSPTLRNRYYRVIEH